MRILGSLPLLSKAQKAVFCLQDAIYHNKGIENSLRSLRRLVIKHNTVIQNELDCYGCFELLCKLLLPPYDEQICYDSLWTMIHIGFNTSALSTSSTTKRVLISNYDFINDNDSIMIILRSTCEAIMSAINRFPNSEMLSVMSIYAFWNLIISFDSSHNHEHIRSLGICEVIVAILVRNPNNPIVAYEVCFAIVVMCGWNVIYKNWCGDNQICELLVTILHQYKNNLRMVKVACEAIAAIAHRHDKNMSKLLYCGGIDVIIDLVYKNFDDETLLWFASLLLDDACHWLAVTATCKPMCRVFVEGFIPHLMDDISNFTIENLRDVFHLDEVLCEVRWRRRMHFVIALGCLWKGVGLLENEPVRTGSSSSTSGISLLKLILCNNFELRCLIASFL